METLKGDQTRETVDVSPLEQDRGRKVPLLSHPDPNRNAA